MSIVDESGYIISTDDLDCILLDSDILRNDKLLKRSFLKYIPILNYFLRHPNNISYDYCTDSGYKTDALKRKAYNNIGILVENGLLRISTVPLERKSKNTKNNPCRLSLSGILYLIFNTRDMTASIALIRDLQKYYGTNLLFKLFLFPVISKKTIDTINYDILFYSFIQNYLTMVGKDILYSVKLLNNINGNKAVSNYGFLMRQIFSWSRNANKQSDDIEER